MGLWDDAEANFRKAATLQPGFAGAFVNLGNLYRDKDDLNGAERSYRHALSLAPHETAARCGLGSADEGESRDGGDPEAAHSSSPTWRRPQPRSGDFFIIRAGTVNLTRARRLTVPPP